MPLIAEALAAFRVTSVTLDGEGVVCGTDGVSDFERLRTAVGRMGSCDAFLLMAAIFGNDPWNVRRETLASLLRKPGDGLPASLRDGARRHRSKA